VSDIHKLVRRQRQKFKFEKYKASLPDAQIIRMPFNADFREKLSSGALDNHINQAIQNAGVTGDINAMLGRNRSTFTQGTEEAKVISMKKFKKTGKIESPENE
jgi:hypothetical protein